MMIVNRSETCTRDNYVNKSSVTNKFIHNFWEMLIFWIIYQLINRCNHDIKIIHRIQSDEPKLSTDLGKNLGQNS